MIFTTTRNAEKWHMEHLWMLYLDNNDLDSGHDVRSTAHAEQLHKLKRSNRSLNAIRNLQQSFLERLRLGSSNPSRVQ